MSVTTLEPHMVVSRRIRNGVNCCLFAEYWRVSGNGVRIMNVDRCFGRTAQSSTTKEKLTLVPKSYWSVRGH